MKRVPDQQTGQDPSFFHFGQNEMWHEREVERITPYRSVGEDIGKGHLGRQHSMHFLEYEKRNQITKTSHSFKSSFWATANEEYTMGEWEEIDTAALQLIRYSGFMASFLQNVFEE